MGWSITQLKRSGAMTHPCFTPVSMENSSDREEARRTAQRGLCTVDVREQKVHVERHRFVEFSTRNHGTLSQRQH